MGGLIDFDHYRNDDDGGQAEADRRSERIVQDPRPMTEAEHDQWYAELSEMLRVREIDV